MGNSPITWQKVAATLLCHPEPESDAARQLVRRMVARGMPCVPGRAGGLFFADQVEAWLRKQAESAGAEAQLEAVVAAPAKRGGRGRSRSAPKASPASPIRERVRQLRASPEGGRS